MSTFHSATGGVWKFGLVAALVGHCVTRECGHACFTGVSASCSGVRNAVDGDRNDGERRDPWYSKVSKLAGKVGTSDVKMLINFPLLLTPMLGTLAPKGIRSISDPREIETVDEAGSGAHHGLSVTLTSQATPKRGAKSVLSACKERRKWPPRLSQRRRR